MGRLCLTRLKGECGVALVMAIGILLVLTIALTTVIFLSSGSAGHAQRSNAGEKAYALAEAGVNNAVAVLEVNYPGLVAYPGDPTLLPSRTSTVNGSSVTWAGTLVGPLSNSVWKYEWRITSTGTVANPTAGTSAVTRTARAIVPVVIPPTTPTQVGTPLSFLYSGMDLFLENRVNVRAQVFVTRDLHLESQAKIDGAAQKVAVGRDLYLNGPQNQIGQTGGADPRIAEVHVAGRCFSQATPALHTCGPTTAQWDADAIFATVHDNTIPASFLSYTPQLTCCAPEGGAIAPAGGASSNMGFWYQFADLGPLSPCTTSTGTPPVFDTAGGTPDNSINLSATPATAINLTPAASYTCKSMAGTTVLGELSWNATSTPPLLTVKGTIFIDGSIYIAPPSGTARYTGEGTIVAAGTFGMKTSTICATHAGYTGACDFTPTSPWDPNQAALVIVADGSAGGGGAQGGGSDFTPGDGIELKGAHFQGALIANKTIRVETTSDMQGPMVSVYNGVWAGQSGTLIFPPILFAPSGGGGIISDPPKPSLLSPQSFSDG